MPFITQGKANLKYIFIVIITATIAGGGILDWKAAADQELSKLIGFTEIVGPVRNASEVEGLALSGVEGWKTYRNEEYGFEVKYPDNAPILGIHTGGDVRYKGGDVAMGYSSTPIASIYAGESEIVMGEVKGVLSELIKKLKEENEDAAQSIRDETGYQGKISEEIQITFKGKPAYIVYNFSWPECSECIVGKTIYIESSTGNILIIDARLAYMPRGPEAKEEIDKFTGQILSTFRFLQ